MDFTNKTVLITGGAGFIGSNLASRLASIGCAEVRVLDHLRCGTWANLSGLPVKKIELDYGTASEEQLREVCRGVDYLFHLAAEKHNQSKLSPEILFRSNISGMHGLLEVAVKEKIQKVIFSSSLYAYGISGVDFYKESDRPQPDTLYGMSKLAGENICAYFEKQYGLAVSVFRFYFVYGPRQFAGMGYKSVILKNFERLIRGESPQITGTGDQILDYIYVEDVLDALIKAIEVDTPSQIFNIGSGEVVSIKELTELMLKVANSEKKPIYIEPDWTAGTRRVADISEIKRALNWQPSVTLEQGLKNVYQWLLQQKEGAI